MKKLLSIAVVFAMLIGVLLPTAQANIKFDKKKLTNIELVNSHANLIPLMPISDEAELITLKGDATATQAQMVRFIEKRNKKPKLNCSVRQIVQYYYEEASREGIRPDIAICQAIKETGTFAYGGDVDPSQNNFCGLGATGNHEPGAKFPTPQIGARAHIQHLLAYASKEPPKVDIVDPRYVLVRDFRKDIFGKLTHWTDLNGVWAVPGTHYGQDILRLWQQAQMPDGSNESLFAANRNLIVNEPTAELYITRGLVYFEREDYYSAEADFQSAAALTPSVEAYFNIAVSQEKINNIKAAMRSYDKAIELDEKFALSWFNRGLLKIQQGDYKGAIADFKKVLEIEPVTADAHNEIGIAYFKMKKYQDAYKEFKRANEINDKNETVLANLNAMESCIK